MTTVGPPGTAELPCRDRLSRWLRAERQLHRKMLADPQSTPDREGRLAWPRAIRASYRKPRSGSHLAVVGAAVAAASVGPPRVDVLRG